MKLPHVSIKNVVLDWVQDNELQHEEINEPVLIKWAVDCMGWVKTPNQLKHRIVVLPVVNSRAELPDDLELITQAAANVEKDKPVTRREQIVQWVQGTLEKDCDLEINLICPTCKKTSCGCKGAAIEVDVDRIWEMAHPEIYYSHFTRVGRFGYGPGQNGVSSYYTPEFELMRYSTKDYFKLQHLVTECPNVSCDTCNHEFIIDPPYIEVDFEEGEVLLSYLGKVLDEDGEIMIPDHPDVHEAIGHHLDYKYYRIKAKKGDQNAARISAEAKMMREESLAMARSSLEMPSYDEFKSFIENSSWMQRIPGWQSDRAGRRVVNQAEMYGRLLDGKEEY